MTKKVCTNEKIMFPCSFQNLNTSAIFEGYVIKDFLLNHVILNNEKNLFRVIWSWPRRMSVAAS